MDSSPLDHQGSFRIFFTLHLWRKLLWKPLLQPPELFSPFPILLSPKGLSLWTCHRFTYWHCFLPVSPALECKLHGSKDTCFLVNCYAKLNKYLLHERNQQMNEHYQRQMTWGRTNITCRTPFKKWQPWNKTVCFSINLFNIFQLAHLGESYFNMYILCFNASVVYLFWSNSGDLGNTINFSMLKAFKPSLKHCSSPSCQTLSIKWSHLVKIQLPLTFVYMCMLSRSIHVWLFETPWTVAHQTPLSMGCYRQEYWSVLPCPPPWNFPDSGIEPVSPALQEDSLTTEPPGKPPIDF